MVYVGVCVWGGGGETSCEHLKCDKNLVALAGVYHKCINSCGNS